jgi:hypothetical protein
LIVITAPGTNPQFPVTVTPLYVPDGIDPVEHVSDPGRDANEDPETPSASKTNTPDNSRSFTILSLQSS